MNHRLDRWKVLIFDLLCFILFLITVVKVLYHEIRP